MEGFKAAYLNELDKLLKKKKIFAAAVISILAVVIGQVAVMTIKSGFGIRIAGGNEFPIVVLSVFAYTVLPLFTAFVAIDMFCGELSANTLKITLTRPVSRFGVYTAKVLNIGTFILANLLFVLILTTLAGIVFNSSTMSFSGFTRVLLSYITIFVPVFVISLFVVLLSNILRGGLLVFFISVLAFTAMLMLEIFFSRYSSFFITSMLDWYRLWISETLNIFKIMRQFFIMAGCGIMFFTAGFYLFDRRDL